MPLVRLTENVHEFTDQLFYSEPVHIYVIEEPECLIVVDGPDGTAEAASALQAFGKPVKIVLTHGPTSRGAAHIRARLGAEVYLHAEDRHNHWLTIDSTACTLWAGNELRLTDDVLAVHTPGHSPGHCCLLYGRNGGMLFSGDAVQGDEHGEIIDPYEPGTDWDTRCNVRSLWALVASYHFTGILPFHYNIIPNDAREKLRHALHKG